MRNRIGAVSALRWKRHCHARMTASRHPPHTRGRKDQRHDHAAQAKTGLIAKPTLWS